MIVPKSTLLLAFLSLLLPLAAQEGKTVSVAVYAFEYAAKQKTIYVRSGPEAYEEVGLSTANLRGPVPGWVVDGVLTFHTEPGPAAEGELPPLAAEVRLPADLKSPLVMLAKAPSSAKVPYQALVLENDGEKVRPGTRLIVNMTNSAVRARVGDNLISNLSPGQSIDFVAKGEPGEVFPVVFQYQKDGEWRDMTNTRWAHRPDRRALICIYQDPRTRRHKLRSIPNRTVGVEAQQ
ncbi:hypothetical protein [Roseibacillus ishigakijimensis]|uniref:Uncharacterized protein n=1 Tax=Roseibacillus ishigakijimensis TaxID=454146 RepID=A0A934RQ63_9BACT|nr:hypothetical protein [Roseibacillus ishigakijimensis]MBK1835454.1 hypothetical protein [Roseibacillus ishigakijimensis]